MELGIRLDLLRHVKLDHLVGIVVASARLTHHHVLGRKPGGRAGGIFIDALGRSLFLRRGDIFVHAHDRVVVVQLAKLLVDDVVDGILQAKARKKQSRAAGDADDGHAEASLIAEEVARGNLPREGQSTPNRTNALQQNALASLGRTREHERRGLLAQGGRHGKPSGQHGDANAETCRGQGNGHIDRHGPTGNGVNDGVGFHDEPRQKRGERQDTHNRSHTARDRRIAQILTRNACVGIAQRFIGTNEHTVLVHHARHGGERNKCCNQEEQ